MARCFCSKCRVFFEPSEIIIEIELTDDIDGSIYEYYHVACKPDIKTFKARTYEEVTNYLSKYRAPVHKWRRKPIRGT